MKSMFRRWNRVIQCYDNVSLYIDYIVCIVDISFIKDVLICI